MKKTTKPFVLSSELKNDKGFRVRSSGIDMSEFNQNPILLWMHKRPKGDNRNEVLPLGNVVDIALKDGKYYGHLSFDDTDQFAVSLYDKVENGTIRMVSPGLIPLEWAKDDTGDVWLEKSKLKEVSLVDIGSNAEALSVALYNEDDQQINLTLEQITKNLKTENPMKLLQLSALAVLPLLKLQENATADEAQEAISNLVTLANDQKNKIVTLTTERDDFKTKYEQQVSQANEAKITTLLDAAVTAGKFVAGDRDKWLKLAKADFDGTKAIIDGLPGAQSVAQQLQTGKADEAILKMSWDELEKGGKLETLKAENFEVFKEKFKAKFKSDYK